MPNKSGNGHGRSGRAYQKQSQTQPAPKLPAPKPPVPKSKPKDKNMNEVLVDEVLVLDAEQRVAVAEAVASASETSTEARTDRDPDPTPIADVVVDLTPSITNDVLSNLESQLDKELEACEGSVEQMKIVFKSLMTRTLTDFETRIKIWLSDRMDKAQTETFNIAVKMDELEKQVAASRTAIQEITTYKQKVKEAEDKLESRSEKDEANEMYSRRDNIRIFGIPEKVISKPVSVTGEHGQVKSKSEKVKREDTTQEALDVFKEKLNLEYLDHRDISWSHRVGRPRTDGKPRAIIVRLVRRADKFAIVEARRKLAGSGIVIREDLTKERLVWMQRIQEAGVSFKSIWSTDGCVYCVHKENRTIVRNCKDLSTLLANIQKDKGKKL